MKKRIAAIATIVLALVLCIAYFIPYYSQREILILAPIIHPAQTLNTPVEWQKWNPALKKYCIENPRACVVSDNRALNTFNIQTKQIAFVVTAKGASYDVTETEGSRLSSYNYTLVPSLYNDSTTLVVTEKTSLLLSLLPFGESTGYKYADSLKSFIENPSSYYGFPVAIVPVVDTVVVSTQLRVPVASAIPALKNMYKSIDDFIQANHLTVTRPRIAHYKPVGNDSVDITAGVPVNKKLTQSAAKSSVYFMQMPAQGRTVVGYYKGTFGGRVQLYQAMDRFLNDKLLHKVAVGFEEYVNGKLPENDSTPVEIKVYYPVL